MTCSPSVQEKFNINAFSIIPYVFLYVSSLVPPFSYFSSVGKKTVFDLSPMP